MTDLFGQPEKPDTRYAEGTRDARPEPVRPWTPQEDLALWTAWVSCNSTAAEQRVVDLFCAALGRPAVLPGNPTTAQLAQERLSLVRRRTIHSPDSILGGGRSQVTALADQLFSHQRAKTPLTCIEWAVFSRHNALKVAKKPRIAVSALLRLLGRREGDSELLATSPDPDQSKGDPASTLNGVVLVSALADFTSTPLTRPDLLKAAWGRFHAVLVDRPSADPQLVFDLKPEDWWRDQRTSE